MFNKIHHQLIITTFEKETTAFKNSYWIILTISFFFRVCFGKDYSVSDSLLRTTELVRNSFF